MVGVWISVRPMVVAAAVALSAIASLWGCKDAAGEAASGTERLKVVCTVGMVTDIAAQVAGDHADVTGMLGAGIDPHLFKPTRSDVQLLLGADVIFTNGLLLEGKMTDSLKRAEGAGMRVVAVTERIDEEYLLELDDLEGHVDPHVWMDPRAWMQAVEVVRDTLIEADAKNEQAYRDNARKAVDGIARVDAYAERVLKTVPESQRVLVTAHDAFNYFGRRYGFEVVGIQGISTESEAGVGDIERLVDLLVERQIGAVFVESTVPERNVRALIDGAAARGHTVVVGGSLFSDAMGDAGTYEGTYIGMIDHNVTTIARGLGGEAPILGMDGLLTPTP